MCVCVLAVCVCVCVLAVRVCVCACVCMCLHVHIHSNHTELIASTFDKKCNYRFGVHACSYTLETKTVECTIILL